MLEYKEVTGKTVDEAFTNALLELETTSDNVDYEVLDKGSSGILGFGSRPAKIKAWKKSDVEAKEVEETPKKENIKKESAKTQEPKKAVEVKQEVKHEVKQEKKESSLTEEQIDALIRNFLDQMFAAMDIKVNIDIKVDKADSIVDVELSGQEMGLLIGKRGQTLDSIQYLVSLVVNKESDKYLRVKVDTEDYRKRRKETLESLAKNIAYKVKRSRRPVSLEPMNPYERRIIHSALQYDKFVATKSEGEEPFRHIIVYLKNDYRSNRDGYKKNYDTSFDKKEEN